MGYVPPMPGAVPKWCVGPAACFPSHPRIHQKIEQRLLQLHGIALRCRQIDSKSKLTRFAPSLRPRGPPSWHSSLSQTRRRQLPICVEQCGHRPILDHGPIDMSVFWKKTPGHDIHCDVSLTTRETAPPTPRPPLSSRAFRRPRGREMDQPRAKPSQPNSEIARRHAASSTGASGN